MSIYHRYALYHNCRRYLAEIEKVGDIVSRCNLIDNRQLVGGEDGYSNRQDEDRQEFSGSRNVQQSDQATTCTEAAHALCKTIHKSQFDKFTGFREALRTITASLRKNIYKVNSDVDNAASDLISHLHREAGRLNGSGPVRTPRMKRMLGLDWWHPESASSSSLTDSIGAYSSPLSIAFEPDDLVWEDQVLQWQQDLGCAKDAIGRRLIKI